LPRCRSSYVLHLALFTNARLGWKWLTAANTLACDDSVLIYGRKSFVRPVHRCHRYKTSFRLYWLSCRQSDQIGQFFVIGILLEAYCYFWKGEVTQIAFWATFWLSNLLHFHVHRQFQNIVCCRYFRVSEVVWCRCFGLLKLSFEVDMLAFWGLAIVWLLLENWAILFPSSGHTNCWKLCTYSIRCE
jgi:hypothetical protein